MQSDLPFLKRLLQYELRCAERYSRFVSLVVVGPAQPEGIDLNQVLQGTVRSSDEMAMRDDASAVVLMAETDVEGALSAVERYKHRYAGAVDLRFGVVTFPEDSGGGDAMMAVALRRYEDAVHRESGAVVARG